MQFGLTNTQNLSMGFLFSGGVGVGADIHINRPETTTMAVYNINTGELNVRGPITGKKLCIYSKEKNYPKGSSKKQRTCRSCGRPIGNKPWECSGGWTY